MKPIETDILVVGAGPAGLSAALEAARQGAGVIVIDENDRPGGQLFKQIHKFFGSARHRAGIRGIDIGSALVREAETLGVDIRLKTTAVGVFDGRVAAVRDEEELLEFKPRKIVLATGAAENPLAFSGWTLPGVMTAGAAQTFVNIHRVSVGKRVVVIGSGNVGLIVAFQLLQAGSEIAAIVEARSEIGGWGVHAAKVRRTGCPIYTSTTIKEAQGSKRVNRVLLQQVDAALHPIPDTEYEVETDTVCLGVGLSPRSELAQIIGCELLYVPPLGGFMPLHNASLATTVDGVYIAGDGAGVEEASTAMEEGRLAGLSAAAALGYTGSDYRKIKQEIADSLDALRQGPFGRDRADAKEAVLHAYAR